MCTRHPDLVSLDFYAIPIFHHNLVMCIHVALLVEHLPRMQCVVLWVRIPPRFFHPKSMTALGVLKSVWQLNSRVVCACYLSIILVMEVLKRGHVPPRHSVYVDRPELTDRIRKQLRLLQESDGWVVVHGMAGFGKTILAAEAIRDATLLQEVFPGGVHWLAVGQMVTKDGEIDQAKLLTRLQNLIVRLDEKVSRPPNLEAANNTLRRILSEQYPRSLLVLDDIWSPEVAQAFSVRCCTMVTSRNSAVASMVLAPQIRPVPITVGFSDEEGLLYVLYVHVHVNSLYTHRVFFGTCL